MTIANLGSAGNAQIPTQETTTSATYTDLATVGPTVTVNVGSSGIVLITLSANLFNSVSGSFAVMSVALSGANTVAAADTHALYSANTVLIGASRSFLLTGLTPGATTFTAKYESTSNTSTFKQRELSVIPF